MKPEKFNNGEFLNQFIGNNGRSRKARTKKYLIDGKWVERPKIISDLGITNGKFCSLMNFYDNDVNLVIRKVNERR